MTVTVTETLDFPVENVWKMISDFGALMRWHPQVLSCDLEGSGLGAERTVRLEGKWAKERLVTLEEDRHILEYFIADGSDPRSVGMTGRISLSPDGPGRTRIEWLSGWPDNHPEAVAVNTRLAAYYPTRVEHLRAALAQARATGQTEVQHDKI